MHYQKLTIENFRNFDRLEISDFKQVNLFVGRNNCGKTSVLEALFLVSGMSNPQLPVKIHSFRDLILAKDEDFSFMFRNLDFNVPINIYAGSGKKYRRLTIKPRYEQYIHHTSDSTDEKKQLIIKDEPLSISSSTVQLVNGLNYYFETDEKHNFSAKISLRSKEVIIDEKYKENLSCSFLNPKTIMNEVDRRIEAFIIRKKLDRLIRVLYAIDPLVVDLRMGTGGMIYVDVGKSNLLPLNIMGDGMRRILNIIVSIAEVKDGILLIDEIENGLHYSTLRIAWKAIFAACREYNVQLFATSHSYECIESYLKTYQELQSDQDELRLFRIDQEADNYNIVKFNAELLSIGLEKEFEVR